MLISLTLTRLRQKVPNRTELGNSYLVLKDFRIWTQNWEKFGNSTRELQFVHFWYFCIGLMSHTDNFFPKQIKVLKFQSQKLVFLARIKIVSNKNFLSSALKILIYI